MLAAPFIGHAASTGAVGELWLVDTSVADTLQTQVVQSPAELSASGHLTYEIGFATKERIDLGFIFDSITLTLARANGSDPANVVTEDVFGVTIAPLSPTGLLGNGGGISVQQVAPRLNLLDDATTAFAYNVEVTLPPGLRGAELQNTFNFFNNGDDVPSRAYAVVVPEPAASTCVVLTGIGFLIWRWQRQSRK